MQSLSGKLTAKIYVVTHKQVMCTETDCLKVLQSDITQGKHIADKENYCELRAQYFVWKNFGHAADYVGFFHFRRYLDLNNKQFQRKNITPYSIKKFPNYAEYTMKQIEPCLQNCDVIAPIWEYTGCSVWKRYAQSPGHRVEDLEKVYDIISTVYPTYKSAATAYLNGKGEYFGNMYLMRYELFQNYCTWLFDILERFDRETPDMLPRTDGYLGERLFGIYYTWLKNKGNVRCVEVPRVFYYGYDYADHNFARTRLVNFFLPPGKKMRAVFRRLLY